MFKAVSTAVLGAAFLAAAAVAANADTTPSTTLPEVTVVPPAAPNTDVGPRASSHNTIRYTHFQVWKGYDADVTMHPYDNTVSGCIANPTSTGCRFVNTPSHNES